MEDTRSPEGMLLSGLPRSGAFSLGESFPPIPARLVKKIQSGEFVDLSELLPDNMELSRRMSREPASDRHRTSGNSMMREVKSLLTWVQCFVTYVAVVVSAHPSRVQEMLAYARLIVREALRNGGDGWRSYDAMFRKLAATDPSLSWGKVLPSLYATTFLASRVTTATSCEQCLEGDHGTGDCALAALQKSTTTAPGATASTEPIPQRASHTPRRGGPLPTSGVQQSWVDFSDRSICKKWNFAERGCKGMPECNFQHACLRCGSRCHKVNECSLPSAAASRTESLAGASNATTGSSSRR